MVGFWQGLASVYGWENRGKEVRPSKELGSAVETRNQASFLELDPLLHLSKEEEPEQAAVPTRTSTFCTWALWSLLNIYLVSSFRQWDTLKAPGRSVWGQVLGGPRGVKNFCKRSSVRHVSASSHILFLVSSFLQGLCDDHHHYCAVWIPEQKPGLHGPDCCHTEVIWILGW